MTRVFATAAAVSALVAFVVASGVGTGTAHAAAWPALPSNEEVAEQRAALLAAAEQGIADARRRWWDDAAAWYTDFLFPASEDENLARLWSVYPLLEALAGVEAAQPTPDHLAALRRVADTLAGRYWNPDLKPVGGYSWYPDLKNPLSGAFFDDSGWLGVAYVDVYEATHDPKYLNEAHRAFVFIVGAGWDPREGGVWWETAHSYKTIEPLAAAVLIGTELYKVRHKRWYLNWVDKLLTWADANSFNRARGLYQRSATDDTVMNYVQGLMIVATQELCIAAKRPRLCGKARQLADAAAVAFPSDWWWAPQYDVVYLRWMLEYYRLTGDPRWYALAFKNARLALENSSDQDNGLYTHGWDGRWIADGLEEHAGNVALMAWTAALAGRVSTRRP